jgi:hypothetical protein
MKRTKKSYEPIPGFYDLREFNIPEKEFLKFWNIQDFLHSWELARQSGQVVPDKIIELSAEYQQLLFAYERR